MHTLNLAWGGRGGREGMVFYRVAQKGLSEEVMFEQGALKVVEEWAMSIFGGKRIFGRGNSRCKGPETGVYLV